MDRIFKYFERAIIYVLLGLMGLIILISTYELVALVIHDLFTNRDSENGFQVLGINNLLQIFSFFLLIIIGVELFETIKYYLDRHVIQAEIILIVALTAIARKVIVMDYEKFEPFTIVGIALIISALSVSYYFIKKGNRLEKTKPGKNDKET